MKSCIYVLPYSIYCSHHYYSWGPVRGVPIIPYTWNDEVIYTLYPKLQTHLCLKSLCLVTIF